MAFKEFDDPQLLRHIQKVLTLILKEFDRVCTELNLPYTVYGGTAIGAVRHQGFVPWDDDIDICMTRADYERFLAEAPVLLGDDFRIDNTRTNPDYSFMFTKLCPQGHLDDPRVQQGLKVQDAHVSGHLPIGQHPGRSQGLP